MANWSNLILTKKGRDLQAKCEAGATLELTRLKIGSGEPDDIENRTDLLQPKQNLSISTREFVGDGTCKISATLTNDGLTEGYYMRELGVFATDPDEGDILYGITTDSAPDFLPAEGGAVAVTQEFAIYVTISNIENVTVVIDPDNLATIGDVETMIEEHNEDPDAHKTYFAAMMVAATPNCYRRAQLMEANQTSITVFANTQVNINGNGYISTKDVTLNLGDVLSASSRAGTDMYVYACEPTDGSTEPVFVLSANSTVPSGYTADNSRKIGGYHCLCADVGTISGHTLSGYKAGDILPLSVWDLQHRAISENEGMVWIEELGNWYDIYIASHDGEKLVSAYGGTVVSGSTGKVYMHGEKFAENFPFVKKRLIWRDEFVFFAKGSNEATNISTSANPSTTGGHSDTDGRRMISNYGLEDCCGVWYQWTMDIWGVKNAAYYPGSGPTDEMMWWHGGLRAGEYRYIDYMRWDDPYQTHTDYSSTCGTNNGYEYSRMYTESVDGDDTGKLGDMYGGMMRVLAGGRWSNASACGSRCVLLHFLSADASSYYAGRGASGPRVVNAA